MSGNVERAELADNFLTELKSAVTSMTEISLGIKASLKEGYEAAHSSCAHEYEDLVVKHSENNAGMDRLRKSVTAAANEWFIFIKDKGQMKSVSYPITFHAKKRKLIKNISAMNEEVTRLEIENRFLENQIDILLADSERLAFTKIKGNEKYTEFTGLYDSAREIISHLEFLLPTVQDP